MVVVGGGRAVLENSTPHRVSRARGRMQPAPTWARAIVCVWVWVCGCVCVIVAACQGRDYDGLMIVYPLAQAGSFTNGGGYAGVNDLTNYLGNPIGLAVTRHEVRASLSPLLWLLLLLVLLMLLLLSLSQLLFLLLLMRRVLLQLAVSVAVAVGCCCCCWLLLLLLVVAVAVGVGCCCCCCCCCYCCCCCWLTVAPRNHAGRPQLRPPSPRVLQAVLANRPWRRCRVLLRRL